MFTKDEQKAQKDGVQKADVQKTNYSLDDVLLGKCVKIARKEKRLTQEELASLCDFTPIHICNVENGKIDISLELIFKISILLGKSMNYFVMDNPGIDYSGRFYTSIPEIGNRRSDVKETALPF